MAEHYDINSVGELIDALGGSTKLGEWLGITQAAVANWKARGAISTQWHLRLLAEIGRHGKSVNPAVFGLSVEDLAGLGGPFVSQTELRTA